MTHPEDAGLSRKRLLQLGMLAVPAAALGAAAVSNPRAAGTELETTPQCADDDPPTIPQMEGPYFKPASPHRANLIPPGATGTRLTVSGHVFSRTCRPLPRVLLDFWQADSRGAYDNRGYAFRGHQFTDDQGRFLLTTLVPGLYPGRTRHLHVKVQAPDHPILTTQLYFPGEPRNNTDAIFDPRLLMTVRPAGTGREATFDFVLDIR